MPSDPNAGPWDEGWCGNSFHSTTATGFCRKCGGAWKRKRRAATSATEPSSPEGGSGPDGSLA